VRLLCLVLDYRTGELVVRCLYRSQDVAGPNTQARRRNGEKVTELTREGLSAALKALEGRVDVVGTSGFMTREDVVLCTARDDATTGVHKTKTKGT
jgi:hypothetical protein